MLGGGELVIGLLLLMAVFTLSTLYTRHYLHNLFEEFTNSIRPSEVDAPKIGEYDQVRKTNCPYSQWRKQPELNDIIEEDGSDNASQSVPEGATSPFTADFSTVVDMSSDDSESSSLFMFEKNVCSPSCCPSTYSCSGGCVCTQKRQRELLKRRGMNKNSPDDSI